MIWDLYGEDLMKIKYEENFNQAPKKHLMSAHSFQEQWKIMKYETM